MRIPSSILGNRGRWLATALCLAGTLAAAPAQTTNAPARPALSTFKIVTERNIFSPRRVAHASERRERRPMSRTETITLVGTMSYEKGAFAFFDGSTAEHRKVIKPKETIAGYTVAEIAPAFVRMSSGTNEVELAVGQQLRREEGNGWEITSAGAAGTSGGAYAEANTSPELDQSNPGGDETASTATDDPVLKKLMQRREQEINR